MPTIHQQQNAAFTEQESDLHCSLGEGRSQTDPVTNWTLISGVELDRDLAYMMQAGKYPRAYLPDFVHELVHHSCFHSGVGTALALLQLRARRRSVLVDEEKDADEIDRWGVLEDTVRYETAISHMRPLAEGLALYGEFDALPGSSRILSEIMMMTGVAFVDLAGVTNETSIHEGAQKLTKLLLRERLGASFKKRKANLLARPLTTTAGGYLPGYLTVKNLWYALVPRCEKLLDTDLYLQYLRTFFYDDYAYVATLLDPATEISFVGAGPNDSAQAISLYFQQRLARLFEFTNDEELSRYEDSVLAGEHGPLLGADPALAQRGRELLDAMVSELDFDGAPDTLEKMLRRSDHWRLAQRDLMCVGSFKAPVRVNEHGRVNIGERELAGGGTRLAVFSVAGLPECEADSGEGSVEFFLSPAGRYSLHAVTLNGKLVAVGSLSPNLTDELLEQITAGYRTSFLEASAERDAWRAIVSAQLHSETSQALYLEHYRKNARWLADAIYLAKALAHTPDEALDNAIALLSQDGFYSVLGKDYDAVMGAARLSLINGFSKTRATADPLVPTDGTDLEFVLAAIKRGEEMSGAKLMHERNGFLYCYF